MRPQWRFNDILGVLALVVPAPFAYGLPISCAIGGAGVLPNLMLGFVFTMVVVGVVYTIRWLVKRRWRA